jgi:hypothetical protein
VGANPPDSTAALRASEGLYGNDTIEASEQWRGFSVPGCVGEWSPDFTAIIGRIIKEAVGKAPKGRQCKSLWHKPQEEIPVYSSSPERAA